MQDELETEIMAHVSNKAYTTQGYRPLFHVSPTARIVIIGQAPGIRAQTSGTVWLDASGEKLISWLGITAEQFRDPALVAHVPMDFYYPGKGKSGDLPPRSDFAPLWHKRILSGMPDVRLTVLIGTYAQKYYLNYDKPYTLTKVVQNYHQYLPEFFPLVHPSPLNFRWFMKNPWFETDVLPHLKTAVAEAIDGTM